MNRMNKAVIVALMRREEEAITDFSGESPLLRVRLSRELDAAVTRAAEQAGTSRADWIRHALAQAARKAS